MLDTSTLVNTNLIQDAGCRIQVKANKRILHHLHVILRDTGMTFKHIDEYPALRPVSCISYLVSSNQQPDGPTVRR